MRMELKDMRIGKIIYDFIFLNEYLKKDGKEDRRLENSPHYKLLAAYEKNQKLNLKKTDYFRFSSIMMRHHGSWFGHTDGDGIVIHIRKFLNIYERIKKEGFDYAYGKIIVYKAVQHAKKRDSLGRPHLETHTYTPEGYEIYEGHHRAVILAKLGYRYIEVDILSNYTLFRNWLKKHLFGKLSNLGSGL